MPALDVVRLAVDAATVDDLTPTDIGSPSAPLTAGRSWLILGRGNCRGTGAGSGGQVAQLDLEVGGVPWMRMEGAPSFGSPTWGAVDSLHLAGFAMVADGDGDAMTFAASDDANDGIATACRAIAIDVTPLPDGSAGGVADARRWHAQGANTDTIVTTPADGSGWVRVGGALTFTPVTTGRHAILASAEADVDAGADETDAVSARLVVDGVEVPGSVHVGGAGVSGLHRLTVVPWAHAQVVDLVQGVATTIEVQANGVDGNGLVGWRRVRIHALDEAAFPDGFAFDTAPGGTVTTGSAAAISGLAAALTVAQTTDVVAIVGGQGEFSSWPRAFVTAGGVNYPRDGGGDIGFANAAAGTGTGPADDMTLAIGFELLEDVASAVTVGMTIEAGAGVLNNWGTDCERAEAGPVYALAIPLWIADADQDGAFESDSDEATEIAAIVAITGGFESDSDEATELGPGQVAVQAWLTSDVGAELRIAAAGGTGGVPWAGDGAEVSMANVIDLLQGSGAPTRPTGMPITAAAEAIVAITAAVEGRGQLVIGGAITAAEAGEVEFFDGDPEGDPAGESLGVFQLAAGSPLPLSVLALWSGRGSGRAIYMVADVAVTGRAAVSQI